MSTTIHWFRRDLRLTDNPALANALSGAHKVQLLFIFDDNILSELAKDDARISFIHNCLEAINKEVAKFGSSLLIKKGDPTKVWKGLIDAMDIQDVYFNEDYEPYALQRDSTITDLLQARNIAVHRSTDHVIFRPGTLVKDDGEPYKVYTPFRKQWDRKLNEISLDIHDSDLSNLAPSDHQFPSLTDIDFTRSPIKVPEFDLGVAKEYERTRNFPSINGTTHLSVHMRFGTVGLRELLVGLLPHHQTLIGELVWREFFFHIIFHFPEVAIQNFKRQYNGIQWLNRETDFNLWKEGKTGYPMVDAGMRELRSTGLMHNRPRMITASFLCKHLLIDWRWGEAHFAEHLLDYDLAVNNGNWQWVAGTGCDSAPYFRIFNPVEQQKKFDPNFEYIKKWVPEFGTPDYVPPIVDHSMARERALLAYKTGML